MNDKNENTVSCKNDIRYILYLNSSNNKTSIGLSMAIIVKLVLDGDGECVHEWLLADLTVFRINSSNKLLGNSSSCLHPYCRF